MREVLPLTVQFVLAMEGQPVKISAKLFFSGQLFQAVNQYFARILSLVTDNNPSWMIWDDQLT